MYIYVYIYIFAEYNQQDALFHNLRRSTCFRQFFHPSSGAQMHRQRPVFVRPILLPAVRLRACSSIGLTNTGRCMCI